MRFLIALAALAPLWAADLLLPLRTRVETFKGSGVWDEVRVERALPVHQTAILICDMWDNHWCTGAARRVDELVKRMAPLIDEARDRGVQIIHSPSEVMNFYADAPQRQRILRIAAVELPPNLNLSDPPLPIDDSTGGCETGDKFYKAWSRQHAGLRISGNDVISDKGTEVYSYLQEKGLQNLLVMGVHTNMCVLNRTFAIKQMTKWGKRCILVRDLTDAMYDPAKRPFVSHEAGTNLVIEHIEKYWAPTVLSADFQRALRQAQ
ncbi:MAG: isochorismatase family protein [Acidobacteria bacterium]|nr:isochorismatase family protein [Acidobacteriota bacterium]